MLRTLEDHVCTLGRRQAIDGIAFDIDIESHTIIDSTVLTLSSYYVLTGGRGSNGVREAQERNSAG